MSIMVKLVNFEITNNEAVCDFYPEDSKVPGKVHIRKDTGEVTEYSLPLGYEWCEFHVFHAARALRKLCQAEQFPAEKMVCWG